jgi:uncharacterized membrane protein
MHKLFLSMIGLIVLSFPAHASFAQAELMADQLTLMKARVLEIEDSGKRIIEGTDAQSNFQTIKVEILDGAEKGAVVTVENDYLNLEEGEIFYLMHTVDQFSGLDMYAVNDPYRLPQLGLLVGLFLLVVFIFGGKQGLRGLASLIGSFLFIFYLLLPGVMHGYSPLLITVLVSSLIIILGSYVTHGFIRTTSAAVIGMIGTVTLTGLLAYFMVHYTRLSGFGADEVIYLNFTAGGSLDVIGLLLGGIIIGLLGVLYDAAIGQSVSVEELTRIAPHVSRKIIYQRALRIGREHIGALVNTLAIAYVGASLPLLLLFYQTSTGSVGHIINTEIFATEIVRIMIGSIGLVLAVPITTAVSVWMLVRPKTSDKETLHQEEVALEHVGHTH